MAITGFVSAANPVVPELSAILASSGAAGGPRSSPESSCAMSAPEMKAVSPAPRSTTTRTSASASYAAQMRATEASMSAVMALCFSGLL